MRRINPTSISFAAGALLLAAALAPQPGAAQGQPRPGPLPPSGAGPMRPLQRGPQTAPAQPYKPVMIKPPAPINDPSFAAFRKQLADIAQRKDRAALTRMLVAQGFFWEGERGDKADPKKPAIANFANALGLDAPDQSGWQVLAGYASDPTGTPLPQRPQVICSPADPVFDEQQFEDMVKATNTEEMDWGYPMQPSLELHATARPNSPVIEKLGMHFVRVLPDEPDPNQEPSMLHVVAPSGKSGYVIAEAISPLGNDQLCYTKDAGGWKIAGFIGGSDQ
jgi:hypothetical protein